ncbi:MAG: hypothetical protein GY943_00175 [Chloroflexi bacterium]|nr:hypothetical protein [Chloroflexota bacterium]
MYLIPFVQLVIKTVLTADQVREILSGEIDTRRLLRLSREHPYFEGTIEHNAFKMSRIIHYRNTSLPVILGEIRDEIDRTTVTIRMRLNWIVIVFMIFWLVAVTAVTAGLMLGFITDVDFPPLFPPITMLFLYVGTLIFFHWEANKAQKYLRELLKAE